MLSVGNVDEGNGGIVRLASAPPSVVFVDNHFELFAVGFDEPVGPVVVVAHLPGHRPLNRCLLLLAAPRTHTGVLEQGLLGQGVAGDARLVVELFHFAVHVHVAVPKKNNNSSLHLANI